MHLYFPGKLPACNRTIGPTTGKLQCSTFPATLAPAQPKIRHLTRHPWSVLAAVPVSVSDLVEEIDIVQYIQKDGEHKLGRVLKVLPSGDVVLESLKKDEEEDNPHGEHAEDIYKILEPLNWDMKQQ
ncbi:hypothetical protein DUNSADRAFT_12641 [Dunaliella salina]|uniref:Uncharacterized protein n=1 Tax=Dunaliella salina TaxID=3046 RepID=A0ABQ7H3Q9_DUNSA|nr:hypothetical protein DUNSADRAFT_12641 [Dunaliella salina]|eukprot:KAF5841475.1 hypothetical protein DUNSADRAFT_12641 [Dunaliella salina]